MIEVIIALINARLTALDLFKDIKGVCEQIQKVEGENTLIYPAQWCGKDYDPIDSAENWEDGLAYHRQIGENTEEIGEEAVTGCDEEVIRTYPMRIVCLIPKDKFTPENNDQFIDDKFATNIANTLKIVNSSSISETLKAEGVSVNILSTQKNRYTVFEEEFTLPDGHVPKFEFAFFFIDYNIIINATQKCFDNFDCDGFVTPVFCDPAIITDSDGVNTFEVPSGGLGTCTPCPAPPVCPEVSELTCQELNDGLTQPQRQVIQRVNLMKSGAVVSYASNDDAAENKGRLVNFLTLDCNNSFGTLFRFTDSVGGQIYGVGNGSIPDYMIDHSTGKGWQFNTGFTIFPLADWPTVLANAVAHNNGTFADFIMPNIKALFSLTNFGTLTMFQYAPISSGASWFIWSSSTLELLTTRAYTVLGASSTIINAPGKTTSQHSIYVRDHF